MFYDPRALELDGPAGVLHAKAIVVENEVVFVTSADLTEAALGAAAPHASTYRYRIKLALWPR